MSPLPDIEIVQRLVTLEQSIKNICEKITNCNQTIDNMQADLKLIDNKIESRKSYVAGVKAALYISGLVFVYFYADDLKGIFDIFTAVAGK